MQIFSSYIYFAKTGPDKDGLYLVSDMIVKAYKLHAEKSRIFDTQNCQNSFSQSVLGQPVLLHFIPFTH